MTKFRFQVYIVTGVIMVVYMCLNIQNAQVSMETGFFRGERYSHLEKTLRQLTSVSNDTAVEYEQNRVQTIDLARVTRGGGLLKRFGQALHPGVGTGSTTPPFSLENEINFEENVISVSGFGDEAGCYFQDRLDKEGLPIIHSIFVDHKLNRIVMIGVKRENVTEPWEKETFICDFSGNLIGSEDAGENRFNGDPLRGRSAKGSKNVRSMTISDPIINDFQKVGQTHQGVLVITCPVPDLFRDKSPLKLSVLKQSNPELRYSGLKICGNKPVHKNETKIKLALCTMLKNMNKFVPDWLKYHKNLGVEHVFIYDNAKRSTLEKWVRAYVENGFVTVIPWAHTISADKTYLETQIASENDCIWRHKHDVEWMIKIDVDEFLQPMDPDRRSLTDYLDRSFDSLGSLKLQNWFFCPPPKNSSDYTLDVLRAKTIFGRNIYRSIEPTELNRGRDKTIVRPANVHYFKIHIVKWGAPSVSLSPTREIRMVHYRGDNPLHRGFCPKRLVKDLSMIKLWRTFK